ncbi:MAG: hypothetical protein KME25_15970 [Symplocastrum torsivum CPER-KK1]|jgi:hypothetical protein|uniref:Uncharacterized protein n=1 Tax=Symplocastrum torsivum CPER-KK1 TaxID=450513 RepID=A0A951UAL5_9CYAN|nr:hypothetical protein [Symplocastrum torsivum CPER-KK1]
MLVTVYCSGSIQKGSADTGKICWTDVERTMVARAALPIEVRFLNPDDPVADLGNVTAVFGRDMYQIQFANFVIVDARQRRGLGIGTEMVISKILSKPLIAVVPPNTNYRKDQLSYRGSEVRDYIHPHLKSLADAVVDDFESAGVWIKNYLATPTSLKTTSVVFDAIETYKVEMLPNDKPMQEIVKEIKLNK